jgi:murein DD-endopeptidase MepM/ murein hydrolase activator NlpD
MKDVNVSKGQSVKQGDLIGTVGKTGRSTGPHLHIQLHWYDMKLDPASVLNLN